MTSSLRRFGALAGAVALVFGLAACSDASSSSSPAPAEIDYSACSTDDSADQNANVDRSGKGNFPSISGDDTPVIAAGKGSEPTDKVLVKTLKQGDGASAIGYIGSGERDGRRHRRHLLDAVSVRRRRWT